MAIASMRSTSMASASMRSTSRLAVAVLLAVATTTSAQGSGSFDVTNVLCLEAFACSADASLPRCITLTAAPSKADLAKHELPPGMPFTQVMGVLPYDVAGLKQHLGTVFSDAATGSGGVKLVVGGSWSKDEARSIKSQFPNVPKGTRRDMHDDGRTHDATVAKLAQFALELEGQKLGVADNQNFFDDVMYLFQKDTQDAYAAAQLAGNLRGDL